MPAWGGDLQKTLFLGRGGACLPVMVREEPVETLFFTDSEGSTLHPSRLFSAPDSTDEAHLF